MGGGGLCQLFPTEFGRLCVPLKESWLRPCVLSRVRNSGVREKEVLENVFMGRALSVFTAVPTRAVFARIKGIIIYI